MSFPRPAADEYAPYYDKYISRVPDGDVVDFLSSQNETFRSLFANVPADRGSFAYAPGKWTLSESLLHVADTERVFAYRALRIGRGDTTALPGFDQNDWVPHSGARARTLQSIVDEFSLVRASTLGLFRALPPEAWSRRGTASGFPVSVRALAFKCAGHASHHEQLMREKYLDND